MKNYLINKEGNGLAWLIVIVAIIIIVALVFTGGKESPEEDSSMENGDNTMMEENNSQTEEDAPVDGILEAEDFKLVTYTNNGFEPKELTIKKGETLRFVNNSDNGMWVGSAMHPTHEVYGGTSLDEHCPSEDGSAFDQCEANEPGGFWEFTFNKAGEWGYHNHVRAADWGRVVVEE